MNKSIGIEKISFDTLINFHNKEVTEELAYLTILYTIMIGIVGFLGSTTNITKSARILIWILYSMVHFTMVPLLLNSLRFHSAVHQEILDYALNKPGYFVNSENSELYCTIEKFMRPHDLKKISQGSYLFFAVVSLCILGLGQNPIFPYHRIEKWIFRRKR